MFIDFHGRLMFIDLHCHVTVIWLRALGSNMIQPIWQYVTLGKA